MTEPKQTERKQLTIIKVEPVRNVGDKQVPLLAFTAQDGDKELLFSTFRTGLFDHIKEGKTITADVETTNRVSPDGRERIDRRVTQIYVDGQPAQKGFQGFRGKSPEELEQSAKMMVLAYAKDLAVAQLLPVTDITKQADIFFSWLKGKPEEKSERPEPELKPMQFANIGEFYMACWTQLQVRKSKVDAELQGFDLADPAQRDKAWQTLVSIYGHKKEIQQ